jgi:hypothetical protein|eukprot:COSAG01_NODE_2997_length_6741_cov_8.936917_3_plen_144_part_00
MDAPAVTHVRLREGARGGDGVDSHAAAGAAEIVFEVESGLPGVARAIAAVNGQPTAGGADGPPSSAMATASAASSSTRGTGAADPLRWFGGARPPPRALSVAQGHFQTALCLLTRLATAQVQFGVAADECEALAAEKARRSER